MHSHRITAVVSSFVASVLSVLNVVIAKGGERPTDLSVLNVVIAKGGERPTERSEGLGGGRGGQNRLLFFEIL